MFIAIPSRYLIRNISPIVPLYNIKCAFKLNFKSEYEWQLIEITWKKIGFFIQIQYMYVHYSWVRICF